MVCCVCGGFPSDPVRALLSEQIIRRLARKFTLIPIRYFWADLHTLKVNYCRYNYDVLTLCPYTCISHVRE